MHVCILSVLHPPFDKRVFHKVATSLVAAGHEVTALIPSANAVADRAGVRFVAMPVVRTLKARCLAVLRLVRRGRSVSCDAYLAVEPESWVAALALKLLTGRRVVFDVHEPIPSEFAKFFPAAMRPFVSWATVRAMRVFARYTDHILLTRESLDEEFAGLSVPRTVVLNTNHLQPMCATVPAGLRDRFAGRPTIIHQGVFGDVRGSYQLLEAMRIAVLEVPEIRCILLGEYVQGDETRYRDAIRASGLDHVFVWEGVVPFEAVPAYIAISQVGLLLLQPDLVGHTYAMPHKLFDYMREGIPVVAPTFTVEVARIVAEADCGMLVDVRDPAAIAEAVLRLLRDPAEAARLGRNGRRIVEWKYNWQNDERALLGVFGALAARKAA
jgi:glycosyltransferase involved in cell wall biosynthesis